MHDVAVIGGSIAGAAIAIHLAARGLDVVVLERAPDVRPKACGEGLFPLGVAELERLGVMPALAPHSRAIDTLRFVAAEEHADATLGIDGRHALGVDRVQLVRALLDRARAAGADVRTGVTVRDLRWDSDRVRAASTDAGDVEARTFVAADGLGSRIRRLAGLDAPARGHRYGVSAHVEAAYDLPPRIEVTVLPAREIYVTPLTDRVANVAVLASRGRIGDFAQPDAFAAAVRAMPSLAGARIVREPLAAGPFPARCTRAWRGNLVLAGDAAGFFDGISGEGLSLALRTAPACTAAVAGYLHTGDERAFAAYDRRRRAAARSSELLARVTLALARDRRIAAFAIRNMRRRPTTFDRLVAISSSELPLRALRPHDLPALLLGL